MIDYFEFFLNRRSSTGTMAVKGGLPHLNSLWKQITAVS
jgi:hypothetical protein